MDEKAFNDLVAKVGKEAALEIQKEAKKIEESLIKLAEERTKGLITGEQFEAFKKESIAGVNVKLQKLEDIAKEQGEKMSEIISLGSGQKIKSIEQLIREKITDIKKYRNHGGGLAPMEISLKAAGVSTIADTVEDMDNPPGSPYVPGIGGSTLDFYDIRKNPNFILNYVDVGRTNQSRLAWLNELPGEGAAALVDEGEKKPLLSYKVKPEISVAKKIAGYVTITEELEDDIPQLATMIRRMLQRDVLQAFNDAVYSAVIAIAPGFASTYFDGKVRFANFWDAVRAGVAQIATANYTPNLIAFNPNTKALMDMFKINTGAYLEPTFLDNLLARAVEVNAVAVDQVLVGDFSQYKVDMYKDLTLRVGWNMDDFTRNQVSVVGELRYHDYISDNRKDAFAYYDLPSVTEQILQEEPVVTP